MLIAEPKGKPLPASSLGSRKVSHSVFNCSLDTPAHPLRQNRRPGIPRTQRVRGQVRGAAVKGKIRPAAAERRQTSVRVLQVQQPKAAGGGGCPRAFVQLSVLLASPRKPG